MYSNVKEFKVKHNFFSFLKFKESNFKQSSNKCLDSVLIEAEPELLIL